MGPMYQFEPMLGIDETMIQIPLGAGGFQDSKSVPMKTKQKANQWKSVPSIPWEIEDEAEGKPMKAFTQSDKMFRFAKDDLSQVLSGPKFAGTKSFPGGGAHLLRDCIQSKRGKERTIVGQLEWFRKHRNNLNQGETYCALQRPHPQRKWPLLQQD